MHRVGSMSLRTCLMLAGVLAGCQRGAPPQAVDGGAPSADAASAADAARDGAALDSGRAPLRERQIRGLREIDRRADFERQDRIELPGDIAPAVAALVPRDEQVKLVEVAVRRGLHKARPAPGERTVELRWVTILSDDELRAALYAGLRAGGWTTAEAPTSPVTHPELGRLSWEIGTPQERASWVQIAVADRDPPGPKTISDASFGETPAWWSARPAEAPVGVELGRYHGRRLGTVFTEFEHFIGAWPSAEPTAVVARLEAAVAAAGYARDDDAPGLWRRAGASPTLFTTRVIDSPGAPSVVMVHHQRRWVGDEPPAPGTTDDAAPTRRATSTAP